LESCFEGLSPGLLPGVLPWEREDGDPVSLL
jgi:hypothetical protein